MSLGKAWNKGLKGIHLSPSSEWKKGIHASPATEYKKGHSSQNKGKPLSEETRRKLSEATQKQILEKGHPFLGKKHTEEVKTRMKHKHSMSVEGKTKLSQTIEKNRKMWIGQCHSEETKQKLSEAAKLRWSNAEYKAKMQIAFRRRAAKISEQRKLDWQRPEYRANIVSKCLKSRRPTDLEQRLVKLIHKYGLPYRYTGDGSFIIGNLNPDFVNVNGNKIAIEVFGGHWHQDKSDPLRTEEGRREILKGYGWKLIVIWGDELKSMPEQEIVNRIIKG